METIIHRQSVAHHEVTHKNIHMPGMRWVTIDLALRAVQDIELLARLISHFFEERLERALIFLRRDKINIGIFAREKFSIISALYTYSQTTNRAQQNRLFACGVDQAIHFIENVRLNWHNF